jgi:hypothetical protein
MTGPDFHAMYEAFNARDADGVLRFMRRDVRWPRAFKGGWATGHDDVRAYWAEQWTEISPTVTPVTATTRQDGRHEVVVHQVVRSLDGDVLADEQVAHVYAVDEDGLITSMEIERASPPNEP